MNFHPFTVFSINIMTIAPKEVDSIISTNKYLRQAEPYSELLQTPSQQQTHQSVTKGESGSDGSLPGPLVGEIWLELAGLGEATGGGEGPGRMLETRGEVCGENGD